MTGISRGFWITAALAHLGLVAMGAASFDWSERGLLGRAIDYYGVASGSSYSYGFFAPGISGQLRVWVDLQDARGKTRTVSLENESSHEADIRVGDIIEQFSDRETDEKIEDGVRFQRSLAGSFALTAFNRYPDAELVTIRLEHFSPVSMAEFRQGTRPEWKPVYQASFRYPKRKGGVSP